MRGVQIQVLDARFQMLSNIEKLIQVPNFGQQGPEARDYIMSSAARLSNWNALSLYLPPYFTNPQGDRLTVHHVDTKRPCRAARRRFICRGRRIYRSFSAQCQW